MISDAFILLSTAVAATHVGIHLWHGVYADSREKQSYSVYFAAPFEMQSLYARGQLYAVRLGRRDLDYDPNLATFQLFDDPSLVREQAVRANMAALFRSRVAQISCHGPFITRSNYSFRGLHYVWKTNRQRSCDHVLVFLNGKLVYSSFERSDIAHVKIGVIEDP